jgi:hypothetical protein
LILVCIDFLKRGAILLKLFPIDKTYLVFNYCEALFYASNERQLTFFGLFLLVLTYCYCIVLVLDADVLIIP